MTVIVWRQMSPKAIWKRVRKATDAKVLWTSFLSSLITLFVVGAIAAAFGLGPHIVWPWQRANPAEPNLGTFLSSEWQVTQVKHVNMDGTGPPEVIVAAVKSAGTNPIDLHPGSLIVLAWDQESRRWSKVFDATEFYYQDPKDDRPIFDSYLHPADLQLLSLKGPGKLTDVAFSANMVSGAGIPGQVVGILRYEHKTTDLAYYFEGYGSGSIAVVGDSHPHLRITTMYYTAVDAHCCPVRDYSFEVAESGGYFREIQDDRPWTGAYIAWDETSYPVVVGLRPGTPAAENLRVGDSILGLQGQATAGDSSTTTFLDAIAKLKPGDTVALDVRRNGAPISVQLKLSSQVSAVADTSRPYLPYLGWTVGASSRGPIVLSVNQGSPAEQAGIVTSSVVSAIADHSVTRPIDVYRELLSHHVGTYVSVTIVPPDSVPKRLQIPLGVNPHLSSIDAIYDPVSVM